MASMAHRTKKVNTYGKKRTNVIAIHDDFTSTYSPVRPEPPISSRSADIAPVSPLAARRPPLKTKVSNDIANVIPLSISSPINPSSKKIQNQSQKQNAPAPVEIAKVQVRDPPSHAQTLAQENTPKKARERKVARPGKVSKPPPLSPIPISRPPVVKLTPVTMQAEPSSTLPESPPPPRHQAVEAAEIPTRRAPSRAARTAPIDISEQLATITLDETSRTSPHSEDEGDDSIEVLIPSTIDQCKPVIEQPSMIVKSATIPDLLDVCSSPIIHDFTSFLTSSSLKSFFPRSTGRPLFRKVGEASYSEVFACRIGNHPEVMIKVVPLLENEDSVESTGTKRGENAKEASMDLPDVSDMSDVLREIETTKRMSQVPDGGFINYLGAFVVEGSYPSKLADEWWTFKTTLGSSSVCPENFSASQRYALILLSDGGLDLETFKFDAATGWIQAAGMFWQVADALSRAEEWTNFEHRDLHEGQILLCPTPIAVPTSTSTASTSLLSPGCSGIKATIIDFGLSRLDMPGSAHATWSGFPEEVYQGQGDQWDVYRSMRDVFSGDWEGFHPVSNVMWLHYIARYLLHRTKSLKKPRSPTMASSATARPTRRTNSKPPPATPSSTVSSSELYQRQIAAYECLCTVEKVLGASIEFNASPTSARSGKNEIASGSGSARSASRESAIKGKKAKAKADCKSDGLDGSLKSAGDVMSWEKSLGVLG